MKDTLKQFMNSNLRTASLALLDKLGMKYTLGAVQPVSIIDLCKNISLSKAANEALNVVTCTYFICQIDQRTFDSNPNAVTIDHALADAKQEKYDGMFVFAVNVNQEVNLTRTVAATLTRVFNRLAFDTPVVLFIQQGYNLSISTCERIDKKRDVGEKLGRVSILRNINCDNPHRGHIDLLSSMVDNNANNFDGLYKKWLDVFDVKLLSKKFYNDLFKWYEWVMQLVKDGKVIFPAYPKDGYGKESKDETIIRIITRMLFVWFIKEKGLIPEKLFKENEVDSIVKDFNAQSLNTHNYYNAILQNLFFATLNCEKDERAFIPKNDANGTNTGYGVNSLYRGTDLLKIGEMDFMDLYKDIPYLNGGLFERLDSKGEYYDGFSNKPDRRAVVPDALFFSKATNGHFGLIKLLESYVFTVEENTPLDQSVSLDPELLGRVFENLLGAYNPETGTTARKSSGSYYTPREVVEYMVNESLVQHITKCGVEEKIIRELLAYKENDSLLDDKDRDSIMSALLNIRIIDPACGSGAFPMGMLQKMVHILRQIDPKNKAWKDLLKKTAGQLANKAYQDTDDREERQRRLKEIEDAFDLRYANPDYARKLFIIQNCIYGVDIQPIAMQISKLRFFISLICEQSNSNILPLPNLETKFVCANTLIGINKGTELVSEELEAKKRELLEVRKQHFYARTAKDKKKYRKKDDKLRTEMEEMIANLEGFNTGEAKQLVAWNPYDQNTSSPFFDVGWMFGIQDGFDIVIGNPPYVFARDAHFSLDFKKQIEKDYFSKLTKNTKSKSNQSGKINLFALFIMKGIMISTKNGILSYIVPNNILRTTTYDLIRKYILDNTSVCQIVDLGSGVFEKVTASTIILQLENISCANNEVIVLTDVKRLNNIDATIKIIPQSQFIQNTSFAFNIFGDLTSVNLTRKIENNAKMFGDYCVDIIEGIVAKRNLIFTEAGNNRFPMLEGKCIKKYSITGINKYIEWNKSEIHRTRPDYLWEQAEKLVTQRISGGTHPIVVAYDTSKFKAFASVNNIVLKDEVKNLYKYFLALLNSNVLNWYYANNFSNNSDLTVNISKTYLEKLPIPKSINNQQSIIDLVNQILTAKKANPQADTSKWESEIDILVYLLYGLTWDEVQIVESTSDSTIYIDKTTYESWRKTYIGKGILPSEKDMEYAIRASFAYTNCMSSPYLDLTTEEIMTLAQIDHFTDYGFQGLNCIADKHKQIEVILKNKKIKEVECRITIEEARKRIEKIKKQIEKLEEAAKKRKNKLEKDIEKAKKDFAKKLIAQKNKKHSLEDDSEDENNEETIDQKSLQEIIHQLYRECERDLARIKAKITALEEEKKELEDEIAKHPGAPANTVITLIRYVSILGEYYRTKKQIVLYLETIRKSAFPSYKLFQTYIHEMFHAYYDANPAGPDYYIEKVEEPITELGALTFIEKFSGKKKNKEFMDFAVAHVEKKQFNPATCHYGFGAYLLNKDKGLVQQYYDNRSKIVNPSSDLTAYEDMFRIAYPTSESDCLDKLKKVLGI